MSVKEGIEEIVRGLLSVCLPIFNQKIQILKSH